MSGLEMLPRVRAERPDVPVIMMSGRAGLARILPAVRTRAFPPAYVLAGGIGALFVFAQSFTVGVLGVALFTVATVTGQTLSGLLVDRLGIGPGGKRAVTAIRVIGCVLTVAAVAWAVSPRLAGSPGSPGAPADGAGGLGTLVIPLIFPVLAGFLMSFQQAMNGTATVHYGSPIAATLVNFVAGSVFRAIRCRPSGGITWAGPWAASSSAWGRCWSAAWECW